MTRVRVDYGGGAYQEKELLRLDAANAVAPGRPPGNTWVLRDDDGDVVAIDADRGDVRVEVQCDLCGSWDHDAAPAEDGRWKYWGGTGPCSE